MMIELPNKKYNIIYADPPWQYEQFSDSAHGAVKAQYNTLNIDELCNIPINKISDDNCILFLWATYPKLKEAIQLLEFWGFRYVTVAFVWIKKNKNGNGFFHGIGFHTSSNSEIVLLGKKGRLKRINAGIEQLVFSPLRKHSQKPDEIRLLIKKLYGDLPCIELFARQRYDGWDAWGNELSDTVQHNFYIDGDKTPCHNTF